MLVMTRRAVLTVIIASSSLPAQTIVCPTAVVPYFGWDATDCGQCNIYGSYLEYLTPPRIRDIKPNGPAAGRLRDDDVVVAVDGLAITTPAAWHRMRDASPGDSLRFSVRRGSDTTSATVIPSARCAAPSDPRISRLAPARDLRAIPPERSISVANALVEISGHPDAVTYDARTGEAIIAVGGVVIRVSPKKP